MIKIQAFSQSEAEDSSYDPKNQFAQPLCKKKDKLKNFGKNILVAIMDFLILIGYKSQIEEFGCIRKEIQNKNSSSLKEIFKILEFLQKYSIDRIYCQVGSSNILLNNPKVLHKPFHLKVIRLIFSFQVGIQFSEFRYKMSKECQSLKKCIIQQPKMFDYESTTIYLLNTSIDIFKAHTSQKFTKIKQKKSFYQTNFCQQQQKNNDLKNQINPKYKKGRQLKRPLERRLKQIINDQTLELSDLSIIFQSIKQQFFQAASNMKEIFKIRPNIPNINIFDDLVLKRCFQIKKKGKKLYGNTLAGLIKKFQEFSLKKCLNNDYTEQEQNESQIQDQSGQEVVNSQKTILHRTYSTQQSTRDNYLTKYNVFSPTVLVSSEWNNQWNSLKDFGYF